MRARKRREILHETETAYNDLISQIMFCNEDGFLYQFLAQTVSNIAEKVAVLEGNRQ